MGRIIKSSMSYSPGGDLTRGAIPPDKPTYPAPKKKPILTTRQKQMHQAIVKGPVTKELARKQDAYFYTKNKKKK